MKGLNTFTQTEAIAIKAIFTRISLFGFNRPYQLTVLRNKYNFYVSDFGYYSFPEAFGINDFEAAITNGDIIVI